MLAGRVEPDDLAVLVDHLQPAADVDGRGRDHPAVLDQRELGGAAADVDVEDALALVGRDARGARAVGRQHRLHVMAGGGGDEIAALLGQQAGDRLRVVAPQRLAGEDHHRFGCLHPSSGLAGNPVKRGETIMCQAIAVPEDLVDDVRFGV